MNSGQSENRSVGVTTQWWGYNRKVPQLLLQELKFLLFPFQTITYRPGSYIYSNRLRNEANHSDYVHRQK